MKENRKKILVIMKSIMLICLIFTVCSCRDTKRILTGGSYQYWHYIDSKLNKGKKLPYCCREDSFYFYLDKNGTYIEFNGHSRRFRQFHSLLYLHYIYKPTWELLPHNKIRFGRFWYKIISVSPNRILMHDEDNPMAVDTLEFVPKSRIPKEYQKYQKPFHFVEVEERKKKGIPFFIL